MAHTTTLASTDRALEKIGDFVEVQDYPSLKAVGRTFAQKAAVLVGLRRSIPKRYAKKAKRRLPAVNSQEGRRCGCTSAAGGLDLRGLYDHLRHKARFDGNGLHRTVLGALAERLAAAPGMLSDYLVQTLENDFPHLIERQRCTFCRGLYEGDGYTHATLSAELCQSCAAAVARTIADDSATVVATP
jgi:hypothetical protein